MNSNVANKLPSVNEVAIALQVVSKSVGGVEIDVRLQVYRDGRWGIRAGDAGFDLDHHGFFGATELPAADPLSKGEAIAIAEDLIEQIKIQTA